MVNNNIVTKMTVRVKEHPVKMIIDIGTNVSIITYPIVKKL